MTTSIQKCIDMRLAGASVAEIASALDLKYGTVTSYLFSAREQGRMPKIKRHTLKTSRPVGRLASNLVHLPEAIYDWLVDQTPDGSTLSETAIAIIIDAYHEENSQ